MSRSLRRIDWRGWAVPLALIALAEIASWLTPIQSDALAAPSAILVAGFSALRDGDLLRATAETLATAVGGMAIGATLGTLIGILCGLSGAADRFLQLPVEVFRPIPSIALLPIVLPILGFGYRLEIAVVAFATIWPMLVMTRAATGNIEPRLMEVARALGLNYTQRLIKIILPAALPRIFVALRISIAIALVMSVTVEVTANALGLGFAMMDAQQSLRPALSLAYLVWIGIIGWGLSSLLAAAQRRFFPRSHGALA
jgi:ABC-type nitrate/sulfonate/bicarbonate transport system permease component